MNQGSLFQGDQYGGYRPIVETYKAPEVKPDAEDFKGGGFNPERDGVRLAGQNARIFRFMRDNPGYHTLAEISAATGDPEASISAQLRYLTTKRFGRHTKVKRLRGEAKRGLWEYKIVPNPNVTMRLE